MYKHMDRKDACQFGVCGWECGNNRILKRVPSIGKLCFVVITLPWI